MGYFDEDEPRSNVDIIRDLVDFLQPFEWQLKYERCPRGCCREPVTKCTECGATVPDPPDLLEPQVPEEPKHKEGCRLDKTLREAEAFLRVEEKGRG